MFALIVVVGAPIAEELFFRGLLLRSIEKRFSIVWAIVGSSVMVRDKDMGMGVAPFLGSIQMF